ncbi:5-hydroxytryptamine receptor 3A [Larimichthys crocea]|uniref:5-hydroxytryptamine receptor 3A n=1 Tax=Larimichthys crocea TaxID=215358 RepID=A0A6G0IS23_LARCR|nr:5-hydroxytryptamine receptor 3A [Larimichthys crocea]
MTAIKRAELIFICFMLLRGFVAALNCTSPTPKSLMKALEKDLFPEKLVRPVSSFSEPMDVNVTITVVGILGVKWRIDGLSWDEKECGTTRISVPRENLWVPDIHINQYVDEDKSPKTPYVYLYNTGLVFDDKPIRVVSSCRLDIYTFPFDIQNCTLTFGSYLHFATDIRMYPDTTAEEILLESRNVLETKGEWVLTDLNIKSDTLALAVGSYSEIEYRIILSRRPVLYVVNLLLPSCFLVTVDLFSFLLPPHSVDRSAFKMTLILGYTVFLLIMNDLLPVTGDTTPLINVFFSISLALMVASLVQTVIITNLQYNSDQYSTVPPWFSTLVLRYIAVIVGLPRKKKSISILNPYTKATNSTISTISSSHLHSVSVNTQWGPALDELRKLSRDLMAIRHQIASHLHGTKTTQEWQMIGTVLDRLLFGLYIIFILVSVITILNVGIWKNSHSV